MGLFDVFKKSKSGNKRPYKEADNRGTRQDTFSKAAAYWTSRVGMAEKDPFILYLFSSVNDAREALLELPVIHVAEDTDKLICDEVLIFGYYEQEGGQYEAILCGKSLSHDLWVKAKIAFEKHGGTRKTALEPERGAFTEKKVSTVNRGKVAFIEESKKNTPVGTNIYRIYSAPSKASAMAFLEKNPVTRKFYYLIVETPEGNFCRDIDGFYEE